MAVKRKSKATSKRSAAPKGQQNIAIIGAVIGVIVLAGIIWAAYGLGGSSPVSTTTAFTTTIASTSSSGQLSAQTFLSTLASYRQQPQFTANYVGTLYSALSSGTPTTGNLITQFQRYNNSAVSTTDISSMQAGSLNTAVYYGSNGIAYGCTTGQTQNYTCQQIPTAFNASTFGLSVFLGALSNSSAHTVSQINSSYDGIPCIALSTLTNNTYNDSGVIVTTKSVVSGCVQPVYRIPLVLNLTSESTAAGSYQNGTGRTTITPVKEDVLVNLHIVNLTNSSSQSIVENLPANAVILGG